MRKHIWQDFIPTYHCVRIFDIPPSFFLNQGYQYIFMDLDNTLASFRSKTPSQEVQTWIKSLTNAHLNLLIVSNNQPKRVDTYVKSLNIPFIAPAGKPSPKKLKAYIKKQCINLKKVVFIGDQVLTDCWMANQLGVDSILTEKLVKEDHWPTWINRWLEKPIRNWLRKSQLLKNWRDFT